MDRQIKIDEKFVKLDLSPLTGNINSLQHSWKLIWMRCPFYEVISLVSSSELILEKMDLAIRA